ncbi:hypothetical protein [Bradymonas sediminis]|uniref:Uncharacterized protein n=1 Tax=Bradymonas sediminis TaxID=1548548 RepID=A0A2Z4FGW9_9DELT|nr:hypothetical protein [Bradymonas sediminis]AWV88217.1 hypothetical protein DN745_02225 [Bradymonas sediminis]TDP77339.1 hypothetical protein DFR33_101239 [Bradymonas sediminis]
MHEQLHADENLAVFLTIEDDGILRLEMVATSDTYDLSVPDEVVVAVEGEAVEVVVEDAAHAMAELGDASKFDEETFTVMLRVHEFFEGWDFGPEDEG